MARESAVRVVEACAAWDRYLVPIYHVQVQAMQDLVAKDRQSCRPRAACKREEPPQEEEEAGGADGRGPGNGGDNGTPPPVEL